MRIEIDVSYQLAEYRQLLHDAGISRTSKGITASRTWDQVKRVQRLQAAYLIELLEGGAMPIPFREIDTEQRQQFEQLLTSIPVVILKPAR
ncbi:MAG: YcxB family protein [Gammaproteobacteria bacterium]|nr:YcxB family protein [Gammaproteobacteria bacterium]